MAPNKQNPDHIHEGDHQHLGSHRVAQPHCRVEGGVETRHGALGNQLTFQEYFNHGSHALVHQEFGTDQQGQRHQEADVNVHVLQERDGRTAAQQLPVQGRTQEERQPAEQRDDDNALAQELEMIVGQMGPAQKLEERAAQDEGKIRRFAQQGVTGNGRG